MRVAAAVVLLLLVVASSLVLMRAPMGYAAQDREHIASGHSPSHWVGTDELGRDRGVRISSALLTGLAGAVAASTLATLISASLGLAAAFSPRFVGQTLLYVSDLFLTLPWLFLLMIVRSELPLTLAPLQSAAVTFLLLALLGWPAYTRVIYAGASALRRADWMVHGLACGLRTRQIVRRHLLPHLFPLLLSQFLVYIPACLVAEANLGTLGLGISEPLPSWGSMLLALASSASLAGSHWVYLPIVLLVSVLLLLELLVFEA